MVILRISRRGVALCWAFLIFGCLSVVAQADSQAACAEQLPTGLTTTRHMVVADLDYAAHNAIIQQDIRHVNRTGVDLTQIVLNLEPKRWQNTITLQRVQVEGADADYAFTGRRMSIELPAPLPVGCEVSLRLDYQLEVPLVGAGVNTLKGFFGHTARQMNLGHWLATLAAWRDDVWITREPFLIGEQEVLEQADWLVTVNLVGENTRVSIAAPGEAMQITPTSWRFMHRQAREFSMSLSDQFYLMERETESGVLVQLYAFAPPGSPANTHALDVAATSLTMYSDLFGPLPYARVLVVQGDFPDGMEFSGLVFVGNSWFVNWPGGPASYLTLITAHEIAHQWWYARVGNDPALHPWLDEALATYSEYIFIEEYHPELKDWWWQFRVHNYAPRGDVDGIVYEFSSVRAYIDAVYLRGVRMLHEIREVIGTEAFFQLLRDYATRADGQIATPELFWSLMTPEQLALTEGIRARYLRHPGVAQPGEATSP